jgi:hypothetical protein
VAGLGNGEEEQGRHGGGWIGERGGAGSRRLACLATGSGLPPWQLITQERLVAGNETLAYAPLLLIQLCAVWAGLAQQLQPIFAVSISFDYEFLHSCEFI